LNLEFILAGFFVGTLVGLTGMGGGSLMTPILVLVLGVRPTLAVGTDLAYAAVTNAAGAWQHFRQGQVRFGPGLLLAAGSIPSTLLGVGLIGYLRHLNGFNVDRTVGRGLAIMLIVVAALLMAQPFVNRRLWPRQQPTVFTRRLQTMRRYRPVILVGVGVVVGFLVGITSVGGGSLVMFAMLLLFPKWPMSQRVGTDVFQSFLLAAAAASAHWRLGDVSFPLVAQLLIGSVPGVLIGSRLTKHVPDKVLRPIVAGALALSAWRLF
jgi:hypothetical protein